MSDTSGRSSPLPLMRYDLASSSWRTCEDTSLWDLVMSSPSFPEWGTTRGGVLFELPTPARPTVEQGSLSLPTPHAGLGERGRDGVYPNERGQQDLQHAISALLPTPVADHSRGLAQPGTAFQSLPNVAISALLPTPRAPRGGSATETVNLLPTPRAQNGEERNQNIWAWPADQPQNLENALALLPTPNATDVGKHAGQPKYKREGHQARIADVIEYLDQWSGAATPPRLSGGSDSPGPRPPLPSLAKTDDHDSPLYLWNG